ncbi:HesA/MoeB/ThiF family protein [Sinirhodobacter sp. WL0062]|uniref:HesA/MoeB/ThiF family protein n=1 Tax=Rhodobacter flavimaris TaxID=2907145 RepID=A0ABS8YX48_9RHOB|nr:HesA/MoeB/ThiF family protein [Sinirhodobacter sp. WL0062]MCE5973870.1 HesA/MoeB/ThiF family protein [Sinirhodobacter sp. WL0062]
MIGLWLLVGVVALGLVLRAPGRLIVLMLGILWGAFTLAHLALPGGHPLRMAVGGSLAAWLGLGGVAAVVLAYAWGLRRLKARARPLAPETAAPKSSFAEAELDRYARHIMLREIGGPGQKKLRNAKVLVVGAGGLGSPVLQYLAAAGVGTIGVVDDDEVSNSNLQRQVIHRDADIGKPKVFSAQAAMQALNPFIEVRPYNRRLSAEDAAELVAEYDLVLDGTDNFDTRYLVNAACVAAGKPLISGAIAQWEGQLSLYDPARDAPCYACVFPQAPASGLAPSCAEAGVVGALPGVVGAMMAAEAIKEIVGAGASARGRLMIYDALWGENRQIGVKRRSDCAVCGARH